MASPMVWSMGLGRDREFETLLAAHGPMLRRIAGSYEADPERRRELEQDILLAVWRALPRFRGEAPVKAFLARIAHNRAVTHVSKEAGQRRPTIRWRRRTCGPG